MPITPTYPGVYIEEIVSSVRTITGVATSITTFIGYTARGPVNQAVRILNFGDYERTFGGLDRDSEIGYAVQQFFLNGGTDAYVVRIAQGATPAAVTLKDVLGHAVLTVSAINPGVWGNYLRVDVDYATSNPDSTFNLYVSRYETQNGALVLIDREQHRNLSMSSHSSTYALSVVNSASNLIKLSTSFSGFAEDGYSLSGKLDTVPPLTANNTTITGIVDGNRPFTLILANPVGVNAATDKLQELVNQIGAAITAAGLSSRLAVGRFDALGTTASATGNFLKLTSLTAGEFSSVEVINAPSNDVAAKLKLGLSNGGREKEGASFYRPAQTGTVSRDLADLSGTISGQVQITITDTLTSTPILATTSIGSLAITVPTNLPTTLQLPTALQEVRDTLQKLIRAIDNPATKNATVQIVGTSLRIVPSATTPNAEITFSDAGATAIHLTSATGAFTNVQQYSLGSGSTGAQTGASPGVDGTPPSNAATLIGSYDEKTGIYALRDVDLFNLLVIPRTVQLSDTEAKSVMAAAVALCEERRAFYIVDPNPQKSYASIKDWVSNLGLNSSYAAIFFPQILAADPLDGFRLRSMPASGAIAGVFARTDSQRGVWKAPAGTEAVLNGIQGLSYNLTDPENGTLNPLGINSLRSFPIYGNVVWGSRTLRGADVQADEYKYIPVRRTALYIEESLYRGLKWVVFEPNDEPLWAQIRLNVGAFMNNLFRQGAFQGKTPREAYLVKCDRETTTQNDINLGIVNILVGFAPLKPAEFVIIKIQQLAGQITT
ncbi:phage tail sheath family protein [Scytonema sp. PRP1]|uniref:phage tail sheath family protein n=1 Tax=Scytonema sp. PRP1 TaxID=3120513 RepID=UPI00300DA17F